MLDIRGHSCAGVSQFPLWVNQNKCRNTHYLIGFRNWILGSFCIRYLLAD